MGKKKLTCNDFFVASHGLLTHLRPANLVRKGDDSGYTRFLLHNSSSVIGSSPLQEVECKICGRLSSCIINYMLCIFTLRTLDLFGLQGLDLFHRVRGLRALNYDWNLKLLFYYCIL